MTRPSPSRAREPLPLILAAVLCILHSALLTGCVSAPPSPPPSPVDVYLDVDPGYATAFAARTGSLNTPCHIILAPGERRPVKLVAAGHHDLDLILDADDIRAHNGPPVDGCYLYRVKLVSANSATLVVTSTPDEAEVLLDGNRAGTTPLSLSNLNPGPRSLRLVHPDCFPLGEEIELPPGQTLRIERRLESRTIPLYRELIRKEPAVMTHYAELAHLYVLRGEFANATQVFNEGVDALLNNKKPIEARRFFMEIDRTYTRWYAYPPETPGNQIRPALRAVLQQCIDRKAWPAPSCKAELAAMDNYDRGLIKVGKKK